MSVSCDINATPTAPDHGDTLIVTYQVDGNDPIDPQGATVRGTVVVAGRTYNVSTDITPRLTLLLTSRSAHRRVTA